MRLRDTPIEFTGEVVDGVERYRFPLGAEHEVGWQGSGWVISVPAGYNFDLSAPWWLRWLLPRDHMIRAAGVHDFARSRLDWPLWAGNLAFLDACAACGVREPVLTASWLAVRMSKRRD